MKYVPQVYDNFRGRKRTIPGLFRSRSSGSKVTHLGVPVSGYKRGIVPWANVSLPPLFLSLALERSSSYWNACHKSPARNKADGWRNKLLSGAIVLPVPDLSLMRSTFQVLSLWTARHSPLSLTYALSLFSPIFSSSFSPFFFLSHFLIHFRWRLSSRVM